MLTFLSFFSEDEISDVRMLRQTSGKIVVMNSNNIYIYSACSFGMRVACVRSVACGCRVYVKRAIFETLHLCLFHESYNGHFSFENLFVVNHPNFEACGKLAGIPHFKGLRHLVWIVEKAET